MKKAILVLGDGSTYELTGQFIIIQENLGENHDLGVLDFYRNGKRATAGVVCDNFPQAVELLSRMSPDGKMRTAASIDYPPTEQRQRLLEQGMLSWEQKAREARIEAREMRSILDRIKNLSNGMGLDNIVFEGSEFEQANTALIEWCEKRELQLEKEDEEG